ncbi:uncharacterized protein MONBRDRAFT_28731 [Monosiga brevicollis MX1]|uniref:Zinc finger PHD-type domain-containing protein n=1 Tax=Monosiga brevicollis TaxID=81824 RepID=A9V910_MONBE|nr:uncharacterized protein MONBRDRAFT_28731 [Monosiga brevicollis MX1]EDQ85973.1 predicted protein [Monosiga brevicollis MX1]|eukprot:XP_001749167.1 hypothetical protein [Monosiga brevicollis MX1]
MEMDDDEIYEPGATSDLPCVICKQNDVSDKNDVVKCKSCGYVFHQACYGVERVPKHDWYCRRHTPYLTIRSSKMKCVACPVVTGALLPVANPKDGDMQFCHVLCAMFIPGLIINGSPWWESVTVSDLKLSKGVCTICNSPRSSATIKCAHSGCSHRLHASWSVSRAKYYHDWSQAKADPTQLPLLSHRKQASNTSGTKPGAKRPSGTSTPASSSSSSHAKVTKVAKTNSTSTTLVAAPRTPSSGVPASPNPSTVATPQSGNTLLPISTPLPEAARLVADPPLQKNGRPYHAHERAEARLQDIASPASATSPAPAARSSSRKAAKASPQTKNPDSTMNLEDDDADALATRVLASAPHIPTDELPRLPAFEGLPHLDALNVKARVAVASPLAGPTVLQSLAKAIHQDEPLPLDEEVKLQARLVALMKETDKELARWEWERQQKSEAKATLARLQAPLLPTLPSEQRDACLGFLCSNLASPALPDTSMFASVEAWKQHVLAQVAALLPLAGIEVAQLPTTLEEALQLLPEAVTP